VTHLLPLIFFRGYPFFLAFRLSSQRFIFLHFANAKILTHDPEFSPLSCSPPSQGEERELIFPESRGKREKGKEGSPLERR